MTKFQRVFTVLLLAAAMSGVHIAAAHAAYTPVVFTVSDGSSPERFVLIEDPNCPPDIICRPRFAPGNVQFTVSVNISFCCQTVTVGFQTVDGTAVAPGDYVAGAGTISFPPGVFSRTISVRVNFSAAIEPTETFTLRLHSPSVLADVGDVGTGTIFDGTEEL